MRMRLNTDLLKSRVWGEVNVLEVFVVVVAAQSPLLLAGWLKLVQCVCLLNKHESHQLKNMKSSSKTITKCCQIPEAS